MRFAMKSKQLTEEAHFDDPRSTIGRRRDGSPYVRLFGRDMTALRLRVFTRDKNSCVDCGSTYWLQLSHNQPHSLGGDDTEENVACRCINCHRKKDLHGQPGHF